MQTATPDPTTVAPSVLTGLTTFLALVERPLTGAANRVLEIGTDLDTLSQKAREYNRSAVGSGFFYTTLPIVPMVVRQAGAQRHLRHPFLGPLSVFLNPAIAEEARANCAERGQETVIEPLTEELVTRYGSIKITEAIPYSEVVTRKAVA
jgi:hypothetical protein